MAYIYKIINDINDKVYVGKTILSIDARFNQHIKDSLRLRNEKRPLYNAMNKYGVSHFFIEPIEECSVEELNDKEQYWINYYDSFKNGYNATKGGDGIFTIDYDLVVNTYLEYRSIIQTARILKIDRGWASKILHEKGIETPISASKIKSVAKIDKLTNEILEIYPSVKVAEEANGNSRHIADVCNGKRKTAKGYKWKYV